MNAKYFFDNLLNGKYCDYESNIESSIKIHHQNSKIDEIYYNIHMDGLVLKTCKGEHFEMNIQQLEGDDFERYSPVRLIKAGYLTVVDAHETLINICDFFNDNRGSIFNITKDYSGNFRNGSAEIWINQTILKMLTIPSLVRENHYRKKNDKISLPFISKIRNTGGIYIFTVDMPVDFRHSREKAEKETRYLIDDIIKKQLGLKCKYVGCRIQRPIYY